MDWLACPQIEQVPGRSSGATVIRGSRVRPEDLVNNIDLTQAELADEFDLPPVIVHDVLAFYRRHQEQLVHPV